MAITAGEAVEGAPADAAFGGLSAGDEGRRWVEHVLHSHLLGAVTASSVAGNDMLKCDAMLLAVIFEVLNAHV